MATSSNSINHLSFNLPWSLPTLSEWPVNSWPSLIALSHPFLTLPHPLCSSTYPSPCLYRGWWGISILAWSICFNVVQWEGPALIYFTCQKKNFWRYSVNTHRLGTVWCCVSAPLILISLFFLCSSHTVTSILKSHCWRRLIIYSRRMRTIYSREKYRL